MSDCLIVSLSAFTPSAPSAARRSIWLPLNSQARWAKRCSAGFGTLPRWAAAVMASATRRAFGSVRNRACSRCFVASSTWPRLSWMARRLTCADVSSGSLVEGTRKLLDGVVFATEAHERDGAIVVHIGIVIVEFFRREILAVGFFQLAIRRQRVGEVEAAPVIVGPQLQRLPVGGDGVGRIAQVGVNVAEVMPSPSRLRGCGRRRMFQRLKASSKWAK